MNLTRDRLAELLRQASATPDHYRMLVEPQEMTALLALAERALEPQLPFTANSKPLEPAIAQALADGAWAMYARDESAALEPQGQALPELPKPDGYIGMTAVGSIVVPPSNYGKHNAYAVFTADQMRDFFAQGFAAGRASQLALPAGPVHEGDALDAQRYRKAVAHGIIVLHNGAKACVGKDEADAALDAIAPSPAVAQPVADERDLARYRFLRLLPVMNIDELRAIQTAMDIFSRDEDRIPTPEEFDASVDAGMAARAALCQPAEEGDKA